MASLKSSRTALKVIDFKPFLEGHDKNGVASAIVESFQTVGFVYLVNHGLPDDKISAMFELVMSSNSVKTMLIGIRSRESSSHCLWKPSSWPRIPNQDHIIEVSFLVGSRAGRWS